MKLHLPSDSPVNAPDFIFGAATSALQIEGADEGRLPSIWDVFCDTPGNIRDHSTARVACDHVTRWAEDVRIMASLGLDAYRFSISWPRVIRQDGTVNQQGMAFYLRLLDRLNELGIKPFVTLYHWDLPQHLQDQGGWLNRDTAWRFEAYADHVTRAFGSRVYSYATLNEPYCSAYLGHETGVHAPGLTSRSAGKQAAHHLLLAHGLAMQVLRANAPVARNGIVVNLTPFYPATESPADQAAVRLADDTDNHWYLRPLLEGRYPDLVEALPGEEVPVMREGDLEVIHQPLDFLGVNYYTRGVVRADAATGFERLKLAEYPLSDMGWEIFPEGLADVLVGIAARYALPPVYITENGIALPDVVAGGAVQDQPRIDYIRRHLLALERAMRQGVEVAGYFYWSLLDNFEWAEGYSKRFGLVHVDYPTQKRTIKDSGHAFRQFLGERPAALTSGDQPRCGML